MAQARYGSMDKSATGPRDRSGRGPASFTEFSDAIGGNMFKVTINITSLERDGKLIGTQHDSSQLRDQLHGKEQETNRLVQETSQMLVKMHSVVDRSNRTQQLQYERLTEDFKNTAQRYQDVQKGIARTAKQKPLKATEKLVDFGDDDDTSSEARLLEEERRRVQLQQQEDTIKVDLAIVQEREQGIRQLETDILDINSIFRDLATMVHEQGETINTIEDNVERASSNVESGNEHLMAAARYQRSSRKKMCILVVILLIVAAIITLIIVLSVKH